MGFFLYDRWRLVALELLAHSDAPPVAVDTPADVPKDTPELDRDIACQLLHLPWPVMILGTFPLIP